MSEEFIYIDYDEALNIYGKMIDASDGGFEGVRDEGAFVLRLILCRTICIILPLLTN